MENSAASLVIIDSVAALVSEQELVGEISDAHIGIMARQMSQACRILTGKAARNKVAIIWINQTRVNIGQKYGDPTVTPGGRALKFYSSLRLCVSRKEAITEGTKDNIVGHQVDVRCTKNKGGVPFQRTQIDLIYPGSGRTAGFPCDYSKPDVEPSWAFRICFHPAKEGSSVTKIHPNSNSGSLQDSNCPTLDNGKSTLGL
ncbi:MAG: hypothetical protein ABSA33_01215 [Candidatus Micrarchaeaceae archaeon]